MFDIRACRGCLSTKGKMEKMTNLISKTYVTVTGLQISPQDGLPNYLCVECHTHTKKLLAFRRRCRRAHYVLKEIMYVEKNVTLNNIMMVNRKRTNLQSSYDRSNPQNMSYYVIDIIKPDIDSLIESLGKYEPEDQMLSVVRQEIDTRSSVLHIDIEPEQEMSTQNEPENEDMAMAEAETAIEKTETPDESAPMDFEDIPWEEEIESETEEVPLEETKKKSQKLLPKNIVQCCTILAQTNIRMLNGIEQKQAFRRKLEEPWFKSAQLKCALCVLVVDNMEDLLTHIDKHNADRDMPYMCKVCKLKFPTEESLSSHVSILHLYEYKCKKCDAPPVYNLNAIIHHHTYNHPKSDDGTIPRLERVKQYYTLSLCSDDEIRSKRFLPVSEHECSECKMRFINVDLLKTHAEKHEEPPSKTTYKCDYCEVYYKSKNQISCHMQAMHEHTYHCKKCPVVAYNLYEAEHHLKMHVSEWYVCQYCNKQFKREMSLTQHTRKMHFAKTHSCHCNMCGDSFRNDELLYRHQLMTHETISLSNPFDRVEEHFCNTCNFQFVSLIAYQLHALKHEHEVANTFENVCVPCKLPFETAEEYGLHIRRGCKNSKLKTKINCPYCDVILDSGRQHYIHHKREHPTQIYRPTHVKLCEQCGQSVADLAEHLRRHRTGGLPRRGRGASRLLYVCALCRAAFQGSRQCRDHILKVHSPVLPYKCEFCTLEFSHGDFLKEHALNVHREDIQPPGVVTPKNSTALWVYPHMKLNLSCLEQSFLDNLIVELWDYLHEKKQVLEDFSDYVILDEPEAMPMKMTRKRRRKNVKVTEVVECVQNLDVIEQDGEQFVNLNGVLFRVEVDRATTPTTID